MFISDLGLAHFTLLYRSAEVNWGADLVSISPCTNYVVVLLSLTPLSRHKVAASYHLNENSPIKSFTPSSLTTYNRTFNTRYQTKTLTSTSPALPSRSPLPTGISMIARLTAFSTSSTNCPCGWYHTFSFALPTYYAYARRAYHTVCIVTLVGSCVRNVTSR